MNILRSIINIAKQKKLDISVDGNSKNRIQNIGEGLEVFVKNSFANTFDTLSKEEKNSIYEKTFSDGGNANNPPDLVIKNGEAIEVKKLTGYGRVPLNSSFPKDKLYRNDPMLKKEFGKIDGGKWESKPMYYYVGTVSKALLSCLFIVDGTCYCANRTTYGSIKKIIKDGVGDISGVEFGDTNELGRVNRVDPLGITNLRIRGMWDIDHPLNVFNKDIDDIIKKPNNNESIVYAIMKEENYFLASREDINDLELLENVSIFDKKVKDPNNTVKLLDVKLIKVVIK